jgi:4-amino-4-deoxy-L-arabinose transferase-like glycosyltransferase
MGFAMSRVDRVRTWLLAILVLAAVLRSVHLMLPIGGWHDWRQADTAAIARNFYESGHSPLYPQIDWRGATDGFVESEFHLYPYLVSLIYRVTGPHDAVGRVVSIWFSLIGIAGVFALARRLWGDRAGLYAAAVLAILPLSVVLGRSFMPESTLLAASVWGVFFFLRWCEEDRWRDYFAGAACVALAIAVKLPALYLGLPLLVTLLAVRGWRALRSWRVWLWALLVLAPPAAWYYHAHQLYLETKLSFGIWAVGTDKWGNLGLLQTAEFYQRVFHDWLVERTLTPLGVGLALIGLFVPRSGRRGLVVDAWFASYVIYCLVVAKGCFVHDYYQAPVLLPAALLIARVFERLDRWITARGPGRVARSSAWLVAVLIGLLGWSAAPWLKEVYRRDGQVRNILEMAAGVDRFTEPDELVIALNGHNPVALYHAHRKGWNARIDELTLGFVENRRRAGATALFGEKYWLREPAHWERLQEIADRYRIIADQPRYFIIRLANNPDRGEVTYGDGWGQAEEWGRWLVSREARIRLPKLAQPTELLITAARWAEAGDRLRFSVLAAGDTLGRFVVEDPDWRWRTYRVPLPVTGGSSIGTVTIVSERLWPVRPGEPPSRALAVADVTTLPLWRKRLHWEQVQVVRYGEGWSSRMDWGRWGLERNLSVELYPESPPDAIVVTATTWPAMERPQRCTVILNDVEIAALTIDGPTWHMRDYLIRWPDGVVCLPCRLELKFADLWPGGPENPRLRSVALGEIRLESTH